MINPVFKNYPRISFETLDPNSSDRYLCFSTFAKILKTIYIITFTTTIAVVIPAGIAALIEAL